MENRLKLEMYKQVNAPKHECVKLNVDVAIDDALGFIGIGVVAKDDRGVVLGAVSRRMVGLFSPHVGECLVTREGAQLVLSCGFSKWIVEMDALNVYKTVYSFIQRSVEANVIDDIRDSCLQVGSGSICYGSCKGNSIAHFLVRLALSNSFSRVWLDVLSKFLSSFVKTNIIDLE
ncbi:hypothetical protein TIFTF001_004691 [Ficus carica]|uniref:RNase H type-1 domain-containing protein n=1 Tax=Ficus carica TaxID=3494 RepID=A0AA87ZDU1_FICCA|nr:hypothetical protein TIFTF001_004691 [Ficus carica]